jgi:hypothetical protein
LGEDLKVPPVPGLLSEKMPTFEGGLKGSACSWPFEREKAFIGEGFKGSPCSWPPEIENAFIGWWILRFSLFLAS